jgi:serine/threonine protein kinase
MDARNLPPTFRTAAIASGLLTDEQLREADRAVHADHSEGNVQARVAEPQLIEKLLELGRLNRWQVEQLKLGRTKFTLGRYMVINSIGQGGMGQVFKAVDTLMDRTVAIKVLPRHKSTPVNVASFTREIRAQAQMDHENLVRAFDAGHDGNVYYLVTEFVPGTDLRKLIRARGRLTMAEAATIISQAAKGLAYAHGRGMVHRDIKPGNLLVTPEGHTKVSDLGLAGFLDQTDPDDPRAGKVVGTADYLAPEQILTPDTVTSAADIYSLGCTLYYAVTGKVPFPGGTTRGKAQRHCEEAPINPRRLNPTLSDEFVEVVAAMMEKAPHERIRSAAEVVERLAPWARDAVANAVGDAARGPAPPEINVAPSEIGETDSGFLFGDGTGEPASQISQGTDPIAAASQETLPNTPKPPSGRNNSVPVPGAIVLLVFGPIFLAAFVLLLSLFAKTIH